MHYNPLHRNFLVWPFGLIVAADVVVAEAHFQVGCISSFGGRKEGIRLFVWRRILKGILKSVVNPEALRCLSP